MQENFILALPAVELGYRPFATFEFCRNRIQAAEHVAAGHDPALKHASRLQVAKNSELYESTFGTDWMANLAAGDVVIPAMYLEVQRDLERFAELLDQAIISTSYGTSTRRSGDQLQKLCNRMIDHCKTVCVPRTTGEFFAAC